MNNIHENESNDARGSGAPNLEHCREDNFLRKQKNHCLKRNISFRLISLLLVVFAGCSILSNLINPMIVGAAGNDKNKLTEEDIKKIIEYLQATNPEFTSYSYDQLNQWFENQTPESFKFEEYPRLYPFCVTHEQVSDPSRTADESHLAQFHEIFEEMERVDEKFYNFNETKHSMVFNKEWVEEIELTRINTPELDMVNLRQWLHIRVKMAQRTQGLYMQTIVGPMGLPFGEFYLDFPCKDDITHTRDMNTVGQLSYCAYRPRTSIQHPSVYVGYDENGRDEFHMHFYWTDITCMETPYLQFLMLIVKDFDYNSTVKGGAKLGEQYLPLLSPVYLNTNFDSKSGAPFPYYPDWRDQMYCFFKDNVTMINAYKKEFPGGKFWPNDNINEANKFPSPKAGADPIFEPIAWTVTTKTYRIQANEAYDACLTGRMRNASLKDEERLECPPGPFRCDTTYGGGNKDQIVAQREELVEKETNISDCFPCGAPQCTLLGFPEYKCDNKPDEIITEVNESTNLNTIEKTKRSKSHGIQAVFAFLILIPLANFMARFYKEVCGHCLCDNGPWIFVHIVAHVLSLMWMWISVGPVMPALSEINQQRKQCRSQYPTEPDKLRACIRDLSSDNPHVAPAIIAFFLQHLLVGFGFWRVSNIKIRNIQIALHSHVGYCCWILGAIATILAGTTNNCPGVLIVSILLLIVPLLFSALGVFLDCLTDRRIGIIPPRKQWPVLETIKLEGKGPFALPKWIVLGVYAGIMVLIWLLLVGSSFTILAKGEDLFKDKKSKLSGIFGQCDVVDAKITNDSIKFQ